MEASPYGDLLEKTRLPQPLLQRSAVSAVFRKLQAAPPQRGFESHHGRDAVSLCLNSSSVAVVDQAVRELCCLLQSALEGCETRFVGLFVKGIGFLSRCTFRTDPSYWRSQAQTLELHPFVKILSCRPEVQEELLRQVLLFIVHNRSSGMEAVSEFIRPFLVFSILIVQSSVRSLTFAKDLVSGLASLSCSLPNEAILIIRLLTGCLEYFPSSNEEEFRCLKSSAEYLVDAFEVVLKQMVKTEMPMTEAQLCRVELLETLLSICTDLHKPYRWITMVELSMRLLVSQRELALPYLPEFSSAAVSLSVILSQVEFEHEQLTILKLLIFLREWISEESAFYTPLELLQMFPVINVLSSSSESVKEAVVSFLSKFEAYMLNSPSGQRKYQSTRSVFSTRCKLGYILMRLLEHLWTELSLLILYSRLFPSLLCA
ncbi:unnamed protein product [Spirodela intermedia]|uniref:DUF3730 domain-containing protein n=1 Tax=Spirodela intermedia TaxID=51605 RepID=A0A7I8IUH1_SPIIN|nr:unnamed protein product [Spirodela intermedia]CAA6661191.1 unnamed protein product [Spirodela intermedia]